MRQGLPRLIALLAGALLISLVIVSVRPTPVEAVVSRAVSTDEAQRIRERSGLTADEVTPGLTEPSDSYARRVAAHAAGAVLPVMRTGFTAWIADDARAREIFAAVRAGRADCRAPLYLDNHPYIDPEVAAWSALPFYIAEADGGGHAARKILSSVSGLWTFAHWVYHLERICRAARIP